MKKSRKKSLNTTLNKAGQNVVTPNKVVPETVATTAVKAN